MKVMCVELGRLDKVCKDVNGINPVALTNIDDTRHIPTDRSFTYARFLFDYWAHKKDHNRVCIIVGGNLAEFFHEVKIWTSNLTTAKVV